MKKVLLFFLLLTAPMAAGERIPVLLELFTSEGCSSCPEADWLMKDLEDEQPLPGIDMIPIAFHVDYWDSLGWKDPWGQKAWTDRQYAYARRLKEPRVYTPQLIAMGENHCIGSRRREVKELAEWAAGEVRHRVSAVYLSSSAEVDVTLHGPGELEADIFLAVVRDQLTSRPDRGENRGKVLRQHAVVRKLHPLGTVALHGKFAGTVTAPWKKPRWKKPWRAIVFAQRRGTGKVLAAYRLPLP